MSVPALTAPMLLLVESGQVMATVAGVDHQLAAGESLEMAAGQAPEFRAAGDTEASALLVSFYVVPAADDTLFRDYDPVAYTYESPIYTSIDVMPGGAGRLRLERLTLPPGSAPLAQNAHPLVWTAVGSGVLGLTLAGERLPFRWKSGTERTFHFAQYLPALQPGTQMTLRNAGDEPLVLYRLSLTPEQTTGAAGTATTGTPVS